MGCTVTEAMERMTFREYKLRLAWMEQQWNKPSRTDYYLMQIAQYLPRIPGGKKVPKIEELKIPFSFTRRIVKRSKTDSGLARQQHSRSTWAGFLKGSARATSQWPAKGKLKD